jgi:polyisoprenoid-binding protein YceI
MEDDMKNRVGWTIALLAVVAAPMAVTAGQSSAPAVNAPALVEVHGGTASFDVGTNIPALRVHGKSSKVEASARLREQESGILLTDMKAVVPVRTLTTGLGLRDEHMRRYVFATNDGKTPDVLFTSTETECATASPQGTMCRVEGQLTIRGDTRPFAIMLKVSREGALYRAVGDGLVKLSDYAIPPPSQLGVSTENEVKLHLEFTATPSARAVATTGGGQ